MSDLEFDVGRYTCRVTLPEIRPGAVSQVEVEWDPRKPDHLTATEKKQYVAGMVLALAGMTRNQS